MHPVEKAAFLAASNNGVPRLGVPPLRYGEALHGVLSGCGVPAATTPSGFSSSGCPTSFPTGLALGASFNRTLWKLVGNTIGVEARALFNQKGIAQLMLFTPDVNPFRDPRWGRGMEVPSEDPFHAGEYAAAYIAGLQAEGSGSFTLAVSMPKHFAVYDQEGNFGAHDRTHFCAPVSLSTLVEYHWPSFRAAIQRGKAGGVMCSANGYGVGGLAGQPSCSHAEFNIGVLRQQWGFEGAMVTDGNGVDDLWEHYGPGEAPNGTALNCGGTGARGPTGAVRVGLRGGVDVELGETLNNFALQAVEDGNITMADIDGALSHTLPFIFRLGLMDPPAAVPWTSLGPRDVDTAAARALALEAATQAVVLLRNDAALVPLTLAGLGKLTIIGPSADSSEIMLANYHGENTIARAHTPLLSLSAAAAAAGVAVEYQAGCDTVLCVDDAGFAAAVAAASGADAVVYFGGGGPWRGGAGAFNATEGEEYDRTEIGLPGLQEALLFQLLATAKPVILVLLRGGPIGLSATLLSDARLRTILEVCYPGELGGDAIAAVLLGAAAPSGRLSTTVYEPGFNETREITDYNMSSGQGVTHMWFTGVPAFPFGFGLSTTTWQFAWWGGGDRVLAAGASPPVPYAVNVTNTGSRVSDISVLAFLAPFSPPRQPQDPLQKLFDFSRAAAVLPGESVTLYFTVPPEAAAVTDVSSGERAWHDGHVWSVFIGAPGEFMLNGTLAVSTGGEGRVVVATPRP